MSEYGIEFFDKLGNLFMSDSSMSALGLMPIVLTSSSPILSRSGVGYNPVTGSTYPTTIYGYLFWKLPDLSYASLQSVPHFTWVADNSAVGVWQDYNGISGGTPETTGVPIMFNYSQYNPPPMPLTIYGMKE